MKFRFGGRVRVVGLPFFEASTGVTVGFRELQAPDHAATGNAREFRVIFDNGFPSDPIWFPEKNLEPEENTDASRH
jgi:hypothetical protein